MIYLKHHGISGQKWGVRNGPPYPLSRQRGSRHKKVQAPRKITYSGEYKIKKYTSPTANNIRRTAQSQALTMALVLATSVVPGGLFAVAVAKNARDRYYKNKNWVEKEGEIEQLKNLKKQTKKTTTEQDMKICNPRRNKQGGLDNCVNCTINMEMRKRGYDTVARSTGTGYTRDAWKNWFDIKEGDFKTLEKGDRNAFKNRKEYANDQYNKLMNAFESYGEGASGYVGVKFEGFNSGHAMFWEVKNGRARIYDGQANKFDQEKVFSIADPDGYAYLRLDDKKTKEQITTMIRSNPKKGR